MTVTYIWQGQLSSYRNAKGHTTFNYMNTYFLKQGSSPNPEANMKMEAIIKEISETSGIKLPTSIKTASMALIGLAIAFMLFGIMLSSARVKGPGALMIILGFIGLWGGIILCSTNRGFGPHPTKGKMLAFLQKNHSKWNLMLGNTGYGISWIVGDRTITYPGIRRSLFSRSTEVQYSPEVTIIFSNGSPMPNPNPNMPPPMNNPNFVQNHPGNNYPQGGQNFNYQQPEMMPPPQVYNQNPQYQNYQQPPQMGHPGQPVNQGGYPNPGYQNQYNYYSPPPGGINNEPLREPLMPHVDPNIPPHNPNGNNF